MPATVASGNLLLIDIGIPNADFTFDTPAGWTLLRHSGAGANITGAWYFRVADGSEGGTTVSFTIPGFGGGNVLGTVRRITGRSGNPEAAVLVIAGSANPNSGSLAASWGAEDNLWITAYFGPDSATVYPTNYTDGQTQVGWGEAFRELNTATEDPGPFTIGSSGAWWAETIVVRPAAAPTPPDAPTNLSAVATGQTTVDLTWDNVADETGYRIERSPNGTTGWASRGTNAADDVTFTDSGSCGTTYFYRVFAFNADGDSPASNTDSATTDACPPGSANRMGGTGAIRRSPRIR